MTDPDTIRRRIAIVAGVGGPKAMIAGHRLRAADVVAGHENPGMSPDAIVDAIPIPKACARCWRRRQEAGLISIVTP